MKKKNILVGVFSLCVIASCIGSLFFVPKLQEQKELEKIKVVSRKKEGERQLNLEEKLKIYTSYESVVQKNQSYKRTDDLRQQNGKEGIGTIADREIQKLDELGVISKYIDSLFGLSHEWSYQSSTYMDQEGNYVVIWDVTLETEDLYLYISIESETEKIIQMDFHQKGVCPNIDKGQDWLDEKWNEYLQMEPENGSRTYWDQVGEKQIVYTGDATKDTYMVWPENLNLQDEVDQEW